jgi:hypothetical protein
MKIFVDYCDCCMLASSSQNILTMGFSDVSGTAFMRVSIHFIFLFFLFLFCWIVDFRSTFRNEYFRIAIY